MYTFAKSRGLNGRLRDYPFIRFIGKNVVVVIGGGSGGGGGAMYSTRQLVKSDDTYEII